jgi:hypothetical protein
MPTSITNHTKLFSEAGNTINQTAAQTIPDDFTGYVIEYARDHPSKDADPSSNFISDTLSAYTEYRDGKREGLAIDVINSYANHHKASFFIKGQLMASDTVTLDIPKLAGYQEKHKFDSDTHSSCTLEDLGINRDNLKSSLLTPNKPSSDSTIDLEQIESLISASISSGSLDLQDANQLASILNRHISDLSTPESYVEPTDLFHGP